MKLIFIHTVNPQTHKKVRYLWTRSDKSSAKEVAGKVTGDAKLESEGKADKAAGKVRIIGGIKDTLRGK